MILRWLLGSFSARWEKRGHFGVGFGVGISLYAIGGPHVQLKMRTAQFILCDLVEILRLIPFAANRVEFPIHAKRPGESRPGPVG